MEFIWDDWNIDHIAEHGVSPREAERVVSSARRPYPRKLSDEKWLVRGRGSGGRFLQVIYVIDFDDTYYIIHARPLSNSERGRFRRGK